MSDRRLFGSAPSRFNQQVPPPEGEVSDPARDDDTDPLREGLEDRDRAAVDEQNQPIIPGLENVVAIHPARPADANTSMRPDGAPSHRSLLHHLTRAGPINAKDPPSLKWLPWIALDAVSTGFSTFQKARTSGGEARGHARIRRIAIETAITAATVFVVLAILYWLVRVVYDPSGVISSFQSSAGDARTNAVEAWRRTPADVRYTVTGIGGSAGVLGAVVKWWRGRH